MNTSPIILHTPTARVSGHYRITAHKLDGSSRVLADWFDNIITDGGLDRLGVTAGSFPPHYACSVGTGTATPVVGDSNLQTFVASTITIQTSSETAQGSPPYYTQYTRTYRFGVGAAAGNISEVGVGWSTGGNNLFSRALILNGGGSPTTITVLSDEYLDVQYSFRLYPPTVDVTGSITISGTSYNYTIRASRVTNTAQWSAGSFLACGWGVGGTSPGGYAYGGTIGAITAYPNGSYSNPDSNTDSTSLAAYGSNNLYRDMTFTWGLNRGNTAGGIKTIFFQTHSGGSMSYQVEFTPVLDKTNVKVLTMVFRTSWARH